MQMMGSNKMILPHSSRLLILPPNINDTIKSEEKKEEEKRKRKHLIPTIKRFFGSIVRAESHSSSPPREAAA